jgi:hypothetical protein
LRALGQSDVRDDAVLESINAASAALLRIGLSETPSLASAEAVSTALTVLLAGRDERAGGHANLEHGAMSVVYGFSCRVNCLH